MVATSWAAARTALEARGVRLRDGDCYWVCWVHPDVATHHPAVVEAVCAEGRRKVAEAVGCALDAVVVHQVSPAELVAAVAALEPFTDPTRPAPDHLSGLHALVSVWQARKHEAART